MLDAGLCHRGPAKEVTCRVKGTLEVTQRKKRAQPLQSADLEKQARDCLRGLPHLLTALDGLIAVQRCSECVQGHTLDRAATIPVVSCPLP